MSLETFIEDLPIDYKVDILMMSAPDFIAKYNVDSNIYKRNRAEVKRYYDCSNEQIIEIN